MVGTGGLSQLKSSSVRFLIQLFVNQTENEFSPLSDVLDGAMITLAMYTMNFAHPGLLLGRVKGLPKIQSTGSSDSSIEEKNFYMSG
jgi:hypothetical protein